MNSSVNPVMLVVMAVGVFDDPVAVLPLLRSWPPSNDKLDTEWWNDEDDEDCTAWFLLFNEEEEEAGNDDEMGGIFCKVTKH